MNSTMSADQLREIFLSTQAADTTRVIAISLSLALVVIVLWLVRRRALQEEYTPIWMGVALVLLILSLNADLLRTITQAMGAWTTSSALFFLGELFLVAICLNYAVRLSRANLRLKNLAQEMSLLRAQVEGLESKMTAPDPHPIDGP
jgi:hypothetical protein